MPKIKKMPKIKNMIEEIFELQNTLNNQTNGEQWTQGITKEGRKINWSRCIYMEVCEAIQSIGSWKHWKDLNAKTDFQNIKIELTDIFHFLVSKQIENSHGDLQKAVNDFINKYNEAIDINQSVPLIDALESIAKSAINDEVPILQFVNALNAMDDFSIEDVYRLYIGKNCLNQFRQDNGYKDGTYTKIWDDGKHSEEDNVYMQKIMQVNPEITYAILYQKLSDIYRTLNT